MSTTHVSPAEVVEEFLRCLEEGTIRKFDLVSDYVIADVVVPDWRFRCEGIEQLRNDLLSDLQVPAEILELDRRPTALGEVFTVTFRADRGDGAGPFVCRQTWLFTVEHGVATEIECFCGGEWYADKLAEMAEAARARGVESPVGLQLA